MDPIVKNGKKSVMDICELGYVEFSRSVVTVCTNHIPLRKLVCASHHAKLLRDYALRNIDGMGGYLRLDLSKSWSLD